MSRFGRYTKLTKELVKDFCKVIEEGNTFKTACGIVGIDESTFYKWKKFYVELEKGRSYDEVKEELKININTQMLSDFFKSIKKSEAEAKRRNVLIIQTKAKENWQASAWWLERRYPDEYGRRDRVDANITTESYAEKIRRIRNKRGLAPITTMNEVEDE